MKKSIIALLLTTSFSVAVAGEKVKVGIIDNGFDYRLKDIASHVDPSDLGIDMMDLDAPPLTESVFGSYNEGTHVSKLVAGEHDFIQLQMIKLPSIVQTLKDPTGEDYVHIKGEWRFKLKQAIRSLHSSGTRLFNLSNTAGLIAPEMINAACFAMKGLKDSVMVIAAGSLGMDLDNKTPGNERYLSDCEKLDNVIIVGAGKRTEVDELSNYGLMVDVYADGQFKSLGEEVMGTSYAAPKVTQALARIIHAKSSMSAVDARNYLLDHCKPRALLSELSERGCFINEQQVKRLVKKLGK